MTTAGGPTAPGTTTRGSTQTKVLVQSVNGPLAIVTDQTGRQMQVRRDFQRAKGYEPQPGEQWIIDKAINNTWTFALCITPSNSLDTDVSTLQGQVSTLQGQVTTLQGQVSTLQTSNASLSTTLTSLQSSMGTVCEVLLPSSVPISANSDTYAAGGWSASSDPKSMVHINTGSPSYVQVPIAGRYHIYFSAIMAGASGAIFGAFITKNSASFSTSLTRDTRNNLTSGNTRVCADREVLLAANDQLFWGVVSSANTTLLNVDINAPTVLTVRWVSTS